MKCDDWIIEVDGKHYAVDRTFSNEPAIYHATSITTCGHISEQAKPPVTFSAPIDCVIIIARELEIDKEET